MLAIPGEERVIVFKQLSPKPTRPKGFQPEFGA
jgi:hypothetical protein